jgi:hypothetical protein
MAVAPCSGNRQNGTRRDSTAVRRGGYGWLRGLGYGSTMASTNVGYGGDFIHGEHTV